LSDTLIYYWNKWRERERERETERDRLEYDDTSQNLHSSNTDENDIIE